MHWTRTARPAGDAAAREACSPVERSVGRMVRATAVTPSSAQASYPPSLQHQLMLLQLPSLYFGSVAVPSLDGLPRLLEADSPVAAQPVLGLPVRNGEVENLQKARQSARQETQLISSGSPLLCDALLQTCPSAAAQAASCPRAHPTPRGSAQSSPPRRKKRERRPATKSCAANNAPRGHASTSPAQCVSESRHQDGRLQACSCSSPCAPAI